MGSVLHGIGSLRSNMRLLHSRYSPDQKAQIRAEINYIADKLCITNPGNLVVKPKTALNMLHSRVILFISLSSSFLSFAALAIPFVYTCSHAILTGILGIFAGLLGLSNAIGSPIYLAKEKCDLFYPRNILLLRFKPIALIGLFHNDNGQKLALDHEAVHSFADAGLIRDDRIAEAVVALRAKELDAPIGGPCPKYFNQALSIMNEYGAGGLIKLREEFSWAFNSFSGAETDLISGRDESPYAFGLIMGAVGYWASSQSHDSNTMWRYIQHIGQRTTPETALSSVMG